MKKILLIILSLILVLSASSCGKTEKEDELNWKIEDEVLIISGHGKMPDYIDENGELTERPWDGKENEFYFIEIEEGITSIGAGAFKDFQNIFEVNLPRSLTSIGESAFERCLSIGSIDFKGNLEKIEANAFKNCYSLYELNIHDNVISIGDSAFNTCYALSKVKIGDSIESIGKEAFAGSLDAKIIEFEGTKARWEELGGMSLANENDTVICSDGTFGE